MLYGKKALFLTIVMVLAACRAGHVAESKFVALDQEMGYWFSSPSFLIKKVHARQWRIAYGFTDNNRCGNRFSGRYGGQLLVGVSSTLRVWLGALADKRNIVDDFKYELRRYRSSLHGLPLHYGWLEKKPDLTIVFYCSRGRAFMRTDPVPSLHMLRARNDSDHNRLTDLRYYRASTLLHEIGHAFGLGDTYVDRSNAARRMRRYNRSDGGAKTTTGKQPLAVMNRHHHVAIDVKGNLQLAADDRDGMQWLYGRYVAKDTKRKSCPHDYYRERRTKGCAPVYPLIFAVKQGIWRVVADLLRDDPSIDLNTQDRLGNTALHYAARATQGNDLYYYLLHKGADDSILNHEGYTPIDLRHKNSAVPHDLAVAIVNELMLRGAVAYATWLLDYAVHQDVAIAKRALRSIGAAINRSNRDKMVMLHYAAYRGGVQLLQVLLQQPTIDVNIRTNAGNTALHYAAGTGHAEATALLLAQPKIDAKLRNIAGDTPHSLVLASIARRKEKSSQRAKLMAVEEVFRDYFAAN